jgi:hypothetical protein
MHVQSILGCSEFSDRLLEIVAKNKVRLCCDVAFDLPWWLAHVTNHETEVPMRCTSCDENTKSVRVTSIQQGQGMACRCLLPRCESRACVVYDVAERGLARFRAQEGRLCWWCLAALYPHRAKSCIRREHLVLAELQRLLPEIADAVQEITWDSAVRGGCSLKRPDQLFVKADY